MIIIDLIDYGPIQRSRIGVMGNISYPSLLGLSISDISYGDSLISSSMYFILAIFLWFTAHKNLSKTYSSKKWRGLTSIIGLLLSLALMYSISSDEIVYLVVISSIMVTMVPDLLSKDESHSLRKEYINSLDQAEDGIRDYSGSRGLGDVYKRQFLLILSASWWLLSALFGESDLLPRLVPILSLIHI